MKQSFWILFSLVVLGITLSSCSSRKAARTAATKEKSSLSEDFLLQRLQEVKLDEEWMQARAKLNARVNGDRYNVTANIMMQRDENIFMSVRKLGFEVARLVITRDSIIVINRLERNYALYDMKGFGEFVGFPVNLNMLQEMLMGNPFINGGIKWEDKPGTGLAIQSRQDQLEAVSNLSLPDFLLQAATFTDHKNSRRLDSKFSNYQQVRDKKYFSYIRSYELNAELDEALSVEIQFTGVEWDKPFTLDKSIPSRFSRVYY